MLPDSVLSSRTLSGSFLFPRNRRRSDLVDFEHGGVDLNDPSEGLQSKVWKCEVIGDDVVLSAAGVAPTIVYSVAGIREISFTFDRNMNPFLAYLTDHGAYYYWFDTVINGYRLSQLPPGSTNPRCALDDKRQLQSQVSDIVLAYIRDTSLYVRLQRDRYSVEYELDSDRVTGKLEQIGMNTKLRFQFAFSPEDRFIPETLPLSMFVGGIPSTVLEGDVFYARAIGVGGVLPYTWSVVDGVLPSGLVLNPETGEITGTVTDPGDYSFTLQLDDAFSTISKQVTIKVVEQLSLTGTLPGAALNSAYSASLSASGGFLPYTWTVSSGVLPTGLSLNSSTGEISGTPTEAGTFDVTIRVTDSSGTFIDSPQSILIAAAVDPYWSMVQCLLSFDGTQNQTPLYDDGPLGILIEPSGNVHLSEVQKQFGSSSAFFDGTSDRINLNGSGLTMATGTGDGTIEVWLRLNQIDKRQTVFSKRDSAGSEEYTLYVTETNQLQFNLWNSGLSGTLLDPSTLSIGQWYHVAITRQGSTWRLFRDGTLVASDNTGIVVSGNNSPLILGVDVPFIGSRDFHGWLDEFRFTKGVARYTNNFTVPTEAFPRHVPDNDPSYAQVVSLLAFDGSSGSTSFTDDASIPNTFLASGNAQLSDSVKKFGTGSLRLDGLGDYISSTSTSLNLSNDSYTIEGWAYLDRADYSGINFGRCIVSNMVNQAGARYMLVVHTNGTLAFYEQGPNGSSSTLIQSPGTVPLQQWFHFAVVRNGATSSGTTSLFLNGIRVATRTGSTRTDYGNLLKIGAFDTTSGNNFECWWEGYVDEVRVTKGVARYTGNFRVPTTPYPRG